MAFAANVFLARTLGPAGYGLIGVATAIMLYLTAVAEGGIETVGVREVAANPQDVREIAASVTSSRSLAATLLALLVIAGGVFLAPQPDGAIVAVYALTLLILGGSTRWVHLGREQGFRLARARVAGELVMAGLVFGLVHSVGDVARVPLAQVVGDSVAALLLAIWLRRDLGELRLRLNWRRAGPIFLSARPMVIHALLGLVIFNSDLLFVRAFHSPSVAGFYVAAYTLISFLINVGIAYSQSLLPVLTRLGPEPEKQLDQYQTSCVHVGALGLPIAVGGALLAPAIIGLAFGPMYTSSALPLAILLASIPAGFIRNVAMVSLIARGRQDLLLGTALRTAVLNVVLNLVLIPRYALVGAAVATVATEMARTAWTLRNARSQGLTTPPAARFLRPAGASLAMGLALLLLHDYPLWVTFPAGSAVFLLALFSLGGIEWSRGKLPGLSI